MPDGVSKTKTGPARASHAPGVAERAEKPGARTDGHHGMKKTTKAERSPVFRAPLRFAKKAPRRITLYFRRGG